MRAALPHEVLLSDMRDDGVRGLGADTLQRLAEALLGGRAAHALKPEINLLAAAATGVAVCYASVRAPEAVAAAMGSKAGVSPATLPATLLSPQAASAAPRTPGNEAAGIMMVVLGGGSGGRGGAAASLAPAWLLLALWLTSPVELYRQDRTAAPLLSSAVPELLRAAHALQSERGCVAAARSGVVYSLARGLVAAHRAAAAAAGGVSAAAEALGAALEAAGARAADASAAYRVGHNARLQQRRHSRAGADPAAGAGAGTRGTALSDAAGSDPGHGPLLLWRTALDNEPVAMLAAALGWQALSPPSPRPPLPLPPRPRRPATVAGAGVVALSASLAMLLRPLMREGRGGLSPGERRQMGELLGFAGRLTSSLWLAMWLAGLLRFPTVAHWAAGAVPAQVRRLVGSVPATSPLRLAGVMLLARLTLAAARAAARLARELDDAGPPPPQRAAGAAARTAAGAAAAAAAAAGAGAADGSADCAAAQGCALALGPAAGPGAAPEAGACLRDCPVCMSPCDAAAALPCGHVACWRCAARWARDRGQCAVCRAPAGHQQLVRLWVLAR